MLGSLQMFVMAVSANQERMMRLQYSLSDKPRIPKRGLIIHNDLDGLLCFLFLRNLGYQLKGIYDLETFYLAPQTSFNNLFAVDLDLSLPNFISLGHHYTVFHLPEHWNLNHWFLFTESPPLEIKEPGYAYEERLLNNFNRKCPLPTILILYWLTDTPLPSNPSARSLLLYADTLYFSIHGQPNRPQRNYRTNVFRWLYALGFDDLINDIKSRSLDSFVFQWADRIDRFGQIIFRGNHKKINNRPLPQMKFSIEDLSLLIPLLNEFAQAFHFPPLDSDEIPELQPFLTGYRYSFYFNHFVCSALQEKFLNGELISHSLIYKNQMEATLLHPLSAAKDAALIANLKPFSRNRFVLNI